MDTPQEEIIKEKDYVILHLNKRTYLFTQVGSASFVRLSKHIPRASLAPLLSSPYGSFFEYRGSSFVRLKQEYQQILPTAPSEADHKLDNRTLEDNSQAQKLTKDEIELMKHEGKPGEDIIKALANSSTTFGGKTEMAKEKWIKRKQKKYLKVVQVIRPTSLTICKVYSEKKQARICGLRFDTLGQLLSWSNIQAYNKVLIFEETGGLIVGSVTERLGGFGAIYSIFEGQQPNRSVERFFNHSKSISSIIKFISLSELARITSSSFSSKENSNYSQFLKDIVGGVDALIIAVRGANAGFYLQSLYPFLGLSGQFCVYSQFVEPLAACYATIRAENAGVQLRLTETWLREYQVLPMRTHPTMQMNGTGGYLFTGVKVRSDYGKGHLETANPEILPPPRKKAKVDQ